MVIHVVDPREGEAKQVGYVDGQDRSDQVSRIRARNQPPTQPKLTLPLPQFIAPGQSFLRRLNLITVQDAGMFSGADIFGDGFLALLLLNHQVKLV